MIIETYPITSRSEWLSLRRRDVTASDIAALFGLSPWKSALQVWAEKTGYANDKIETALMRRGRWLEPAVLEALRESYPHDRVEKLSVYLRDPDLRLGATPDAMMNRRLVEAKVVSRPVFDAWNGDPPMAYQLQALTGAMLTSADNAIIACLVIDTYSAALETFHVERNKEAENRIRDGVKRFWENTAAGIRPEPDYGEDGALITRLFKPREELPPLDLSSDNRLPEILGEREGLRRNIAAYEARCDAIRAEVVTKLNGAPAAICGDWKITHKLVHLPEQIRKAHDYPRLTVTRKKEEPA
jgi:putative phage-type endonuclease